MKGLSSYVTQWSRESVIFITAFLIGSFLFIAVTAYGASVIGSAITGVGTSTPLWGDLAVDQQASQTRLKGVFVVGDNGTTTPTIFVSQKGIISFGSSTPSPLFLNQGDVVIGRNGSTNDLYVSGGLGVGNATTSDGDFVVGDDLYVYSNGRIGIASSSPVARLSIDGGLGAYFTSSALLGLGTTTPWKSTSLAINQSGVNPPFVVGSNGTSTPTIFVSAKGIISFGSSSPSALFLNQGDVVIGRNGSTNDLYVSGGLGVGNATTTDNDFVVGSYRLSVFNNNRIGMFGTTSPAIDEGLSLGTNTGGTNAHLYVSGGLGVDNATTSTGDFIVGIGTSGRAMLGFSNNGRFVVGTSTAMTSGTATTTKFVFDGGDASFSSGSAATTTFSILNTAGPNLTNACIEMSTDGILYRVFINAARTGMLVEAGSCMN